MNLIVENISHSTFDKITIRFDEPITFSDHAVLSEFIVRSNPRSGRGVVFAPAAGETQLDRLVDLIATTSLKVYDALLDER